MFRSASITAALVSFLLSTASSGVPVAGTYLGTASIKGTSGQFTNVYLEIDANQIAKASGYTTVLKAVNEKRFVANFNKPLNQDLKAQVAGSTDAFKVSGKLVFRFKVQALQLIGTKTYAFDEHVGSFHQTVGYKLFYVLDWT